MEIIYFLVPISLVIMVIAIIAFFWAVNNQQFDDLDSPASMMLFDDFNDEANRHSSQKQDSEHH